MHHSPMANVLKYYFLQPFRYENSEHVQAIVCFFIFIELLRLPFITTCLITLSFHKKTYLHACTHAQSHGLLQ